MQSCIRICTVADLSDVKKAIEARQADFRARGERPPAADKSYVAPQQDFFLKTSEVEKKNTWGFDSIGLPGTHLALLPVALSEDRVRQLLLGYRTLSEARTYELNHQFGQNVQYPHVLEVQESFRVANRSQQLAEVFNRFSENMMALMGAGNVARDRQWRMKGLGGGETSIANGMALVDHLLGASFEVKALRRTRVANFVGLHIQEDLRPGTLVRRPEYHL